MYKKTKRSRTSINVNEAYLGETIEQKIHRIVNNKEPIKDGAPLIYQERKDGVSPDCDMRTDRFDVAIDAMDKVTKTHKAKRDQRLGEKAKENMKIEEKTNKDVGGDQANSTTP